MIRSLGQEKMGSTKSFVTEVEPNCSDADWVRIYDKDRQALPSQSITWMNGICKVGGYRMLRRRYVFDDGIEAGIALFAKGGRANPLRINSSPPPAWGRGGPISTRPLEPHHLRAIFDDCAALPGAAVQMRPNPMMADLYSQAASGSRWTTVPRNAHVLDLAGGFDHVWTKLFQASTRNHARKAERLGITVDSGSSPTLVAEFDDLFRLSIERWARKQNEFKWLAAFRGHLRDPRRKFFEMARLCSNLMRISIARRDGKAIAGIVILYGHNAHYIKGAMDQQAVGNSGANALLHMTAIKEACDRGCHLYHMGESGASVSLATFKEQFGAVAYPHAEYRHERLPILSTDQKLRAIVKRAIGFRDA